MMSEKVPDLYLLDFVKNDVGATYAQIMLVEQMLGISLPHEYVSVMRKFNGGEGEVGENSWLVLFPMEELIEINHDYDGLMSQIPEYFLFGKDSADTGYAFHKQQHAFYSFGLMSDFKTDYLEFCGNSFHEFLHYLYFKSSLL